MSVQTLPRETSYATAVVTNYETETHTAKHSNVIWPGIAHRNEHAAKKKYAGQHTELFATKRRKEKVRKEE